MDPQDSKQDPAAPPGASKRGPSRSVRSVYVAPPASKPSVAKPPASKPSVAKPPASKPSVAKPPASKPSVAKPAESKRPKKAAPTAPSDRLKPPQAEHGGPRKHAEAPELSKTAPQEEPVPGPRNLKEKVAIQERAVGRAKVPDTFSDSIKRFCFSPTGLLKILRMILIIAAVIFFVVGQADEIFIAITVQEVFIVLFFILVYMDLINSFISAVFLLVIAVLTWQEKERSPLFYNGGVFCLTAAILCLIDALVVTKKMRNNMKVILGIKTASSQAQEPKPQKPKPQKPKPQKPKPQEPKPPELNPQEPNPPEPNPQEPKPQEPKPQQSKYQPH